MHNYTTSHIRLPFLAVPDSYNGSVTPGIKQHPETTAFFASDQGRFPDFHEKNMPKQLPERKTNEVTTQHRGNRSTIHALQRSRLLRECTARMRKRLPPMDCPLSFLASVARVLGSPETCTCVFCDSCFTSSCLLRFSYLLIRSLSQKSLCLTPYFFFNRNAKILDFVSEGSTLITRACN